MVEKATERMFRHPCFSCKKEDAVVSSDGKACCDQCLLERMTSKAAEEEKPSQLSVCVGECSKPLELAGPSRISTGTGAFICQECLSKSGKTGQ